MWVLYALGASLSWGLGYTYSERVMGEGGVSPLYFLFVLVLIELPIFFALALYAGGMRESTAHVLSNPELMKNMAIAIAVFVCGNCFIFLAVAMKNATHVNLLEITYPIFTVLFTLLIFKTWHLTPSAIVGGLMVLSGAALLVYKG